MFFNNPELTNAGRALIINALAGGTITFSKLGLGNGVVPDDVTQLTDLVNPCATFGLTSITTGVGGVALTGSLDNSSLEEDFTATELGVYALDPNTGDDVLYALARPYGAPTTIPAGSNSGYGRINMTVVVAVGDAENVTAIISEFIGYATITAFNEHVGNTDNPHRVTKMQIGLGNVPNVSTNNQTPTFVQAEDVADLESGETVRVLFGKLKAAVSSLIRHLRAVNPHHINPGMIHAANASHTHSSNGFVGTMKVGQGGTGKSNWSPSRLIFASTAALLSQVPLPTDSDNMVLNQTQAGALSWVYPAASEHGQYIGNNQAGSSHPTTLTFKRTPSLIIVRSSKAASLDSFSYGVIFPWALVGFSVYNPGGSSGTYVELKVSNGGSGYQKTVSWYDTEARPAHQLCTTSEKYFYTAIY